MEESITQRRGRENYRRDSLKIRTKSEYKVGREDKKWRKALVREDGEKIRQESRAEK